MSKADEAYEAAVAEIERVIEAGETELQLAGEAYHALEVIPEEIAAITGLQTLALSNTQVTDLTPLAGITGLQTLALNST